MRYSDKMYNNMMSLYTFGAMNNADVLTDFYTRLHTCQYRLLFASLADDYLMRADQEDQIRENKKMNIKMLRQNGENAKADGLEASLKGVDAKIAGYKKKAANLLNRSLEVMPASIVIDYGEPTANGREKYTNGGVSLNSFSDGVLHDYVRMLYKAGDKKAAEELGAIVATQLESIFTYFEKSDAYFAGNPENSSDLFAALDAYFKLHLAAIDPDYGNPKGAFAARTQAKIDKLYKNVFPDIYSGLSEKANDNGESIRRGSKAGRYANMLFNLQDYLEAIGVHYGYLQGQQAPPAPTGNGEMSLEQMMEQMPIADSVNE